MSVDCFDVVQNSDSAVQIGKNKSSEEVRRLAARLRVMMDELMSIQTAILFSNLRLAGSLTPARPMLSPEEWHSMMVRHSVRI